MDQARLSDERWLAERLGTSAIDRGTLKSEANLKTYHPTPVVVLVGKEVSQTDRRLVRIAQFAQRYKSSTAEILDLTFVDPAKKPSKRFEKLLENPQPGLRIIALGDVGEILAPLRANPDVTIFDGPVVADGLITGLMLLRERSTSITTHRFGNTFTID